MFFLMFQMTQSVNHPVNFSGILHVLDRLRLSDIVIETPGKAALMFVVPEDIAASFRKHRITGAGDNSPLMKTKNIGEVTQRQLNYANIKKIGQFRSALSEMSWQPPAPLHRARLQELLGNNERLLQFILNIPQFVWVV